MHAAALNHRDLFITQGLYAGIQLPSILGSDGAGLLDGQKVIINPGLDWGPQEEHQDRKFRVLGMPDHGTFAEQILIPKIYVHPMPAHLAFEAAAALPLAGLTAYRAVFSQGRLAQGQRVLITGIGGGVALFAMQFALAAGASVFVTSGSDTKIQKAVDMGAEGGINYKQKDWAKELKSSKRQFDLIIDSAGGPSFRYLLDLADFGARIVVYGGTVGKIDGLSPQRLFWKQLSIIGSTMGSPADFSAMLNFVEKHEIQPVVDRVFAIHEAKAAFQRMENGDQFGKIVLKI